MNRATATILARSSRRFFTRHPAQLLLSFIGIVLGVGIVTAVLITNASSQRAFSLSSEALYGRTTHQILGASGVAGREYAELRRAHPSLAMAPVVEGELAIGNELFSLLGLDPLAESTFGRSEDGTALFNLAAGTEHTPDNSALLELLLSGDALAMAEPTWRRLRLPLDTPLTADAGGYEHAVRIVSTFSSANPAASEGLVIADIATAQDLLDTGGELSRIDLILDSAEEQQLAEALSPTLRLVEAASRERTMQAMTRGFQINLTAMSLLALVVGAFLIHNTMTFAVLQRRELFARLRITGVSARALLGTVLCEAVVIGTAGSVVGIALGWGLAHALIRLTTRTINDLYFVLHVQQVSFEPWLAIAGLALGIGTSVIAATVAALDASASSPAQASRRSLAESRARDLLPRLALAGTGTMLFGAALALLPLQSLIAGFAALMLLIVGYGMALPWIVLQVAKLLSRPAARLGTVWSLAAGGIERNVSRTGLAIAALAIAVSATLGVEVMITSFRTSVDEWLDKTLGSDIYISAPSTVSSSAATTLDPLVVELARTTTGVSDVSTGRVVDVSTDVGTIDLLVLDPHPESARGFEFLDGEARIAWKTLVTEDAVLISEPLSTRHALEAGDELTLFTDRAGHISFSVAGVVRDYGSSHGRLTMTRATWARWWEDTRVSSLGLLTDEDADSAEVLHDLRERLGALAQPLHIRSNEAIHDTSLAVFDRTFEVTKVLRWLTVGVAFVGIFSALLALHLERAREFAVLRASGATRGQIGWTVAVQTLLMGLIAGHLSLPLGWAMSEVLIRIINVRSFGWSMQTHLPLEAMLSAMALACLSAMLAGAWPAWRLSRHNVAAQLRDE